MHFCGKENYDGTRTLIIYLISINRQNWTKIVVYPLLGGGSLLGRHGDGHGDGPGAAPLQERYLVRYGVQQKLILRTELAGNLDFISQLRIWRRKL